MKIIVTEFDDWKGLYVNGDLKCENHSLHYRDIFEALGIEYEVVEIDMEELNMGRLPDSFTGLKDIME